ncbi:uncharacterized protein LOC18440997 [Amborella trichopoda]|uniref:Uncharacterized protein n=1 Tax=Amborella trichopoda TaxID=13333 RepID=W1PXZ2_AMBTC|nr:uncharacterized protein LOC18440997 [Amborella trichopoda]ERN12771.1 hypothetical protein AMTR_s00043p00195000 [Amborella trichopoda]|eukprot:XP_006851190.1 uncharacterized protein LOC18440997 [Amborella trichopoda]
MGGGAIRSASKFASFGLNGSIRGASVVPVAEKAAAASSRKASRISTTGLSSASEDGRSNPLVLTPQNKPETTGFGRSSWEVEDWEFAGVEEEYPLPRVVFGSAPTQKEVEEAASDLKDAFEKAYLSTSTTVSSEVSSDFMHGVNSSMPFNLEDSETKACVTSQNAVAFPSMQSNVMQAFSLLKENSDVQNIVTSLATDKSVWEAVLKNEKVVEFCQAHQQRGASPIEMAENLGTEELFREDGDKPFGNWGESLKGLFDNARLKAMELMSTISEFFHSFLGIGSKDSNDSSGVFFNKTIEYAFMLAFAVIIVVLMKRV